MPRSQGYDTFAGGFAAQLNRKYGIKQPQIPPAMIERITILPNGATYTKLKPGTAVGAETVELWRNFRMCGR